MASVVMVADRRNKLRFQQYRCKEPLCHLPKVGHSERLLDRSNRKATPAPRDRDLAVIPHGLADQGPTEG